MSDTPIDGTDAPGSELLRAGLELQEAADVIEEAARGGGDVDVRGVLLRGDAALDVAYDIRAESLFPLAASAAASLDRIATILGGVLATQQRDPLAGVHHDHS